MVARARRSRAVERPTYSWEDTITSRRQRTYRDAGVDIQAGAALVDAIKPLAQSTARPGADAALGGFGGLFDLKAAGYSDPILVAATDGAGTKVKLAVAADRHDTIGIDLVAMCVNDLVVQGAEPLFFLDYFATASLNVKAARDVMTGIAAGCREAGCALIGGETAEMPGLYAHRDYDLAGFAVGAVERGRALTGAAVADGDIVLGLASNGLHANGFSLVRRVVSDLDVDLHGTAPFDAEQRLCDALLTPTRIYVKSCLAAARAGTVKALAHITGGGLVENVPRVLPDHLAVEIEGGTWPVPAVFPWLSRTGGIAPSEMLLTFNCGIGMVAITAPDSADAASDFFSSHGETVCRIGRVIERSPQAPGVHIRHDEALWPS